MPIPFRNGLFLEFDAPLTKPRHDLIVLQLDQVRQLPYGLQYHTQKQLKIC